MAQFVAPYTSFVLGSTNIIPVTRHLLHSGAKFDFESVTFPASGGGTLTREIVRHPGSVIVLPLLDSAQGRSVVLIRNWRVATESWLWELPAGTRAKGEDPAACAMREVEEETGYTAATLEPLCRFHTSPGLSDELMWAYVATGLKKSAQRLEVDERIEVHVVSVARALELVCNGEMTDAKSILVLLWAERAGLLNNPNSGTDGRRNDHGSGLQ